MRLMTNVQTTKINLKIQRLEVKRITGLVTALAVNLSAFLLLLVLPALYQYLPNVPPSAPLILVGIAVASLILALLSSFALWRKIIGLESQLG